MSRPDGGMTTRYVVKEELASGGMGTVYRVFDRAPGERARAQAHTAGAADPSRSSSRPSSASTRCSPASTIPASFASSTTAWTSAGPYYTMELLAGRDMRKVAPLPYRQACLYLRDVATSLALLHARRFLHRDLSPANVRMTDDGRCKLLDFGALAVFGHSRVVVGTPSVMPPEAFAALRWTARGPLFPRSAGLLDADGPARLSGGADRRLADAMAGNPPPPSARVPGIPDALDALVLSLLSRQSPRAAGERRGGHRSAERRGRAAGREWRPRPSGLRRAFSSNPRFIGRAAPLETLAR